MTKYIVVSNRRGGVGKTTITMMLAYGLSVLRRQRVLVIDLDAQASSSMVIMGNVRFKQAQRDGHTSAHMLQRMHGSKAIHAGEFVAPSVGDVLLPDGLRPHLDMIASSHELDDRETEIVISRSAHHPSIQALFAHIQNRIGEIIRTVDGAYDQVIVDCAPGLSHVVWGAFRSADFVVVPYFPDQTAEDNVGWLCKRLDAIGLGHQYRTVANRVAGVDKRAPGIIGSIEAKYGTLGVQVPATQPLATALDFRTNPESLASKFGTSNKHVKDLTDAMLEWMNNSKKVAVA